MNFWYSSDRLPDVRVEMKRDTVVRLLHRESQELSHQFASGDLELLRVLGDEFIKQRFLGRDGFDVIHEKSVDDEVIVSGPLHEDCLLAVYRRISVVLHPCRDPSVPSTGRLLSPIDSFLETEHVALWNGVKPPIWRLNVSVP